MQEQIATEPQISVRSVTMLTGLNEHTLRAWERRYGAVKPERTAKGRRFYTRRDVERLRLLAALGDRGFAIGQIAALPDAELGRLMSENLELAAAPDPGALPLPTVSKTHAGVAACLRAIEQATASYDLSRVHSEIARARARFGARAFALDVVSPLMGSVGRLITRGEFSIAQEHALSAIVRAHLLDMFLSLRRPDLGVEPDRRSKGFAITTMEGDLHEIGILISAVLCADHGLPHAYIGPNMPPEALAEAATALGVGCVILGVSPLPPGMLPRSLPDYLRVLARGLPASCEIWVGGRTGLDVPDIKALKLGHRVRAIETLPELERLLAAIESTGG